MFKIVCMFVSSQTINKVWLGKPNNKLIISQAITVESMMGFYLISIGSQEIVRNGQWTKSDH